MMTLREYRKAAGITQGQLAEKVGVRQAHISRIESGITKPGWKIAQRIQEATKGAIPVASWADNEKGAA